MYDLIIIGGGAAGLAGALYAKRFALNVAIVAKEFGGTGNIAHQVDNWIGDPGIGGFDLMQKFINHVKEYEVPMITGTVDEIKKSENAFSVVLENGDTHETKMLQMSNGMEHRKLGIPGEEEFTAKGVHYCYTCDGPLYKDKILAVAGGSDSAVLGSLFLTEYGSKVYTIFRKENMSAEPISVERVKKNPKIEIIPSSNITEIIGEDGKVKKLKLDTGKEIELDGLFIEIGQLPLNKLAKSIGVETDARGYIIVDKEQKTNIPKVFAAGDITNAGELKQFITSAAEGSIAAQTAYHSK